MKNLVLILMFLGVSVYTSAQTCSTCADPNNDITRSGSTMTARSAQAYYWEVCSGPATISGSNTSRSITLNLPSCTASTSKVRLVRFVNGNCVESCEVVKTANPSCPPSSALYVGNEGGGGLCTTGYASLSSAYANCIAYIDWTWALGGHTGSAGRTTSNHWVPIYYPSGNWNNYYLVVYAKVTLVNGTVCNLSKSLLLSCGSGPTPIQQTETDQTSMYPNPIKPQGTLTLNDLDAVSKEVEIFDMHGTSKGTYKVIDNSINIGNLEPGNYFILYRNEKGVHKKHFIVE